VTESGNLQHLTNAGLFIQAKKTVTGRDFKK